MKKKIPHLSLMLISFFLVISIIQVSVKASDGTTCYYIVNENNELEWFCEEVPDSINGTGCWLNCE